MVTILKNGFVVEVSSDKPFDDWGLAMYAMATLFEVVAQNQEMSEDERYSIGHLGPVLSALATVEPKESIREDTTIDQWKLSMAERIKHRPNSQSHDDNHQG